MNFRAEPSGVASIGRLSGTASLAARFSTFSLCEDDSADPTVAAAAMLFSLGDRRLAILLKALVRCSVAGEDDDVIVVSAVELVCCLVTRLAV